MKNFKTNNRPRAKPVNKSAQLKIEDVCKPNANDTTGAIITFLNYNGFHVWRNNTHGVYDVKKQTFRRLQYQQKGVSDIIGFRKKDAKFIAVEIKIGADSLSPEQHGFLNHVKECEGFAFVVGSFDEFVQRWEYRKREGLI